LIALVIKSIKHFEDNEGIFFLALFPPLLLLISFYLEFSEMIERVLLIVFVLEIVVFPFVFLMKKLKKKIMVLLVFFGLLIEWDWIITWIYLNRNSLEELNPFLNINNFFFFSIQKLLPFAVFLLLYLVSKDNKDLFRSFEIILVVITISYSLLFLWQLYVVALFNHFMFYILPLAVLSIFYFIFMVVKNRLSVKDIKFKKQK
jgi:hypothetical protein